MTDLTQAVARVNKLYKALIARRPRVQERHEYVLGAHPLKFASTEWAEQHRQRYHNFSDNWCEVVASAAPERTEVYGLRLGDDSDVQSSDERALWRAWDLAGGPEKAAKAYLTSSYAETAYVQVWGTKDGEPIVTDESPLELIIDYDAETGAPIDQLKAWTDDEAEYATYSTPTEILKLQRPRSLANPSGLILPAGMAALDGGWTLRDAQPVIKNPLGVIPGVELPNRPLTIGGPVSNIQGTMAMQDAINLMWAYLFSAADFASMPARVVLGAEPPKMPILNELGQKVGEQVIDIDVLREKRLLFLTNPDVKIGQWEAAKLDVFTNTVNVMVKHVAAQTKTPIHYILGELGNVNGETLTATERPLSTKVKASQRVWTTPTREIFRRLALVQGNAAVAEQCRSAVVQWSNPETASDAQISDAAAKDKTIGWPFAAILERRYNLSQPEIARVMDQLAHEASDPVLSRIVDKVSSASGAF